MLVYSAFVWTLTGDPLKWVAAQAAWGRQLHGWRELPPLAAGGLQSAGRFSAVLFPAFLWLASVVPGTHLGAWIASFSALHALNAALFYTWRPLY